MQWSKHHPLWWNLTENGTSALICHLLSLSLWGAESKDIRPYNRPLDGFPLRLERTSSILTKASSSVFITYLAGRIFVCITQRTGNTRELKEGGNKIQTKQNKEAYIKKLALQLQASVSVHKIRKMISENQNDIIFRLKLVQNLIGTVL